MTCSICNIFSRRLSGNYHKKCFEPYEREYKEMQFQRYRKDIIEYYFRKKFDLIKYTPLYFD